MAKEGCQGKCGSGCGKCGLNRELVEKLKDCGTPVGWTSPDCQKWLKEHGKDCAGCQFELGCRKYSWAMQIMEQYEAILGRLYEVKTPEEMKEFEEEFGAEEE
jgi:hypothetical protein